MKPSQINVLIACEESQAECLAFRRRGFNAYSCDIQKPRYEPRYHIRGDVTQYLHGETKFKTEVANAIANQWGNYILDDLSKARN